MSTRVKASTPSSKLAREFLFFVFAFVVGFFISLAVCVWLFVRFGREELAWWEYVPTALEVLLASATGGIAVCGAALWLSRIWRTLTITHRCVICDRRQSSPGFCADCKPRHLDNPTS
jgi:hypothetical protein